MVKYLNSLLNLQLNVLLKERLKLELIITNNNILKGNSSTVKVKELTKIKDRANREGRNWTNQFASSVMEEISHVNTMNGD